MGCKDYFRSKRLGQHPHQLGFNIAAGATVLLPLFMWIIGLLIREGEGEGNREEERGQRAALGIVYIWSLVVFGCIVWHGNQVLESDSKELLKVLLASLAVFSNFALLLSILTGSLAVQGEGKEVEDGGWLGQFPAAMVLTFALWTVFGLVWSFMVYRMIGKPSNSSDYRRQDNPPIV